MAMSGELGRVRSVACRDIARALLYAMTCVSAFGCETVRVRPELDEAVAVAPAPPPTEAPAEPPAHPITSASLGLVHGCAVSEGAVSCWGTNDRGVVNGGREIATLGPTRLALERVVKVAVADSYSCAVHEDGTVTCWGLGPGYPSFLRDAAGAASKVPLEHIVSLSAGKTHLCGVTTEEGVRCLGVNDSGQRADDRYLYTERHRPNDVELASIVEVAAGRDFTCARDAGGAVHCFGANYGGQLGDGGDRRRARPARVRGIDDAIDIATSFEATLACALRRRGDIVCWGTHGIGRAGEGRTLVGREPVALPALDRVGSIAVGLFEVYAVLEDGTVRRYAQNLGEGDSFFGPPEPMMGLEGVLEVVVGPTSTCARTEAGALECWGMNDQGQLGDGTREAREGRVTVEVGDG
jgi:alpha-tubulin suppressor-like RCC1 family protein